MKESQTTCDQCDWRGSLSSFGAHQAVWHLAEIHPGSYPKGFSDGWTAALQAGGG